MILDILTILFFVLGFVLILQMIGERRRDVLHGPYVTKEVAIMASRRSQHDPILFDRDRNLIRDDRRVKRVVLSVAQHELKGMLTRRKFDARLGLARSKMEMRLVLGNWFVGIEGLIHINQQVVMAAVWKMIACMSYAHVSQTKATPKSAFDGGAVLRPHKIEKGILWRGLSLGMSRKRQTSQSQGQCDQPDELHDPSSFNAPQGDSATRNPWVGYRTSVS